jgi:hypothetical protein
MVNYFLFILFWAVIAHFAAFVFITFTAFLLFLFAHDGFINRLLD